jgi:hypothetical protein
MIRIFGLSSFWENYDTFFLMFPVDKSKFFKFAAIMTNSYDISFQFFRKRVVGDSSGIVENVLKEAENLSIAFFIEVKT